MSATNRSLPRDQARHQKPVRLRDLLVTGCYVRRRRDGQVFQIELVGRHVMCRLKPDIDGKDEWVSYDELDAGYEVIAS